MKTVKFYIQMFRFSKVAFVLSVLWLSAFNVFGQTCANLTPYQPSNWDNKIVLSTVTGTNTSASTFYDNQTIYLDWAEINNGSCNITKTFYTNLYLDGILQNTYNTPGLNSGYYGSLTDLTIGPLAAGSHTFKIVIDSNKDISETIESDNEFSRTITVIAASNTCANLTPYQPSNWDNKIVLSTVTGTNTSASTFYDNQTIYLDWAEINNGSCNITKTFYTNLYLDGILQNTYNTPGLNSGYYGSLTDLTIGPLAAGSHTFKIVIDSNKDISETNESDNEFSRTITVVAKQGGCTSASVATAFNGTKTINTDNSNIFRLNDICQTSTIHIRDYNSTTDLTNPLEISSSSNTWTTTTQRFGGSVLWAVKQAYNYFLNVHSRKSYDNSNGSLDGYVNAYFSSSKAYYSDNASMSWPGGQLFVGLGSSGTLSNCFGTLDIIAHEYTHAVTASSAGLEYHDESGALNESFSDIFGEIIEYSVLGINDWLMGAERSSGPFRSMSNPKDFGQPDTYLSTNNDGPWYTGTGDNGGVHTNSGVQNFWFYLLVRGGSGTNDNGYTYSVTGIGMDKAAKIAYKTLTGGYLTSTSDYSDACQGSIKAAESLYGVGSTEVNAVTNAWCAVGVGSCKPDLIVQSAQVASTTLSANEQTTVSCYIKNQSDIAAKSSITAIWLSKDQNFDGTPKDTYLTEIATPVLGPNQISSLLSTKITIPAGISGGIWYMMFGADAIDDNNETDENNNVFVQINVITKPNTPVISLNGSKLHSDAPTGNQWYNQNGQIIGETNQNYTFIKSGNYYVIVSISGVSSEASNIINVNTTDIPETANSKTFKIYPNPVSGILNIDVSELNSNSKFEIINLTGQVIYNGKLTTKTVVQTSSFPIGVYFLKLENGNTVETQKIVIK